MVGILHPVHHVAVALLLVTAVVGAQVFIPPMRYNGFLYKDSRGKNTVLDTVLDTVLIEAFYDPVCPYSRDSWEPLRRAVDHYGPSKVSLIVHLMPLPYHDNAFVASRALHIVNALNSSATYHLLDQFFKHQTRFYTRQTLNMSRASIIHEIVNFTTKVIGDSLHSAIKSGFNDSSTDLSTRVSFKYASSRGVFGTPTFFVNGFTIQNDSTIDVQGWRGIIEPLVS